jgi:hypothetical protein
MTAQIGCEIAGCKHPASSHITWGASPQQRGNLCDKHIAELWGKAERGVMTGLNYWIQEEPKVIA